MVASQAIRVGQGRPPTTCPAIRLRVVANSGRRDKSILLGDVYINIYTKSLSPARKLASIYNVVEHRLSGSQSAMTTTNGSVGDFYEANCEYPLYDEELGADRHFLASRWHFAGQNKAF